MTSREQNQSKICYKQSPLVTKLKPMMPRMAKCYSCREEDYKKCGDYMSTKDYIRGAGL